MPKENNTTTELCFSSGTGFMNWQDRNCCRCVKAIWYNEKKNDFPAYRCAAQRDIEAQRVGLHEISKRSYDATQKDECPFRKTERKVHKKRKIKNQTELKLQLQ